MGETGAERESEGGGGGGEELAAPFATLHILQIIKEAQAQHGLRHADYQRYAAYAARRIRRIRKSLRFTHTHKSVPKHPAKFGQKKVTAEVATEPRYLLVLLFDAERAWATGQQLKQEATAEEAPRKRLHAIARLRKAVKHGGALEALCSQLGQVDAPTKLEAGAYAAYLRGCLAFEMEDWPAAIEAFEASKDVYTKLARVVGEPTLKALYEARVAEMGPQLRYAAYNIGDETAVADLMAMRVAGGGGAEVEKLVAATLEKTSGAAKSAGVRWGGAQLDLDSLPRVSAFAKAAAQLEKDLKAAPDAASRLSLQDGVLGECRDAIQAVRDEAKKSGAGDLSGLLSYLTHQRLRLANARYVLMLRGAREGGKAKPGELVRLLDSLCANLEEAAALKELQADAKLAQATAAEAAYFRAFRAGAVGEAFVAGREWAEGMALAGRAKQRIDEAKKAAGAGADFGLGSLDDLAAAVKASRQKAAAGALMEKGGGALAESKEEEAGAAKVPLCEDLGTWRTWKTSELLGKTALANNPSALAPLPPPFMAMPGKPLFFDLALNHVSFPDLRERCEAPPPPGGEAKAKASAEAAKDGGTGGIGGVVSGVKGWFWGSK